ncbi:MAG: hypothetical protein F4Z31_05970 [Gemmatimonadetes bacterium]|nr:hypothetical protein [Gemmatimonadota bacterium]
MAITITNPELAVAIRAAADADAIAPQVASVLGFLAPAASAIVLHYAADAPDPVHNAAMIRLVGWLYDADPTDSRVSRALEVSGAAGLLARWRSHRAGAIGAAAPTPGGGDVPAGAGLPPLPGEGHFILAVDDGELVWLPFPKP